MNRLLLNAIQTPDGTTLESRTRHDYKEYKDANGLIYMVDGGLDYQRRNVNKLAPEIELSLSEGDMPHEGLRGIVTWGTYGKLGDQPLFYKQVSDMETGHIRAVLDTQRGMYPQIRDFMEAELLFRSEGGAV